MYKKNTYEPGMPRRLYREIWLIMRLTTIILLVTLLQVSAATHAQNVTLTKSNASLKSIFTDIKKQTGYLVLYPSALVKEAKPVTVELKNVPLKEALDQILGDQNMEFEIQDNSIEVREKEVTILDRIKKVMDARDAAGSVIDENGQPLVGASVRVKNGKESAVTNKDGIFSLKGIAEHSILVITYIGYKEKEINIDEELINIKMELSDSKLDEVQVQAYGKTSKRISTSNITTIKAKEIEDQPVQNPLYAMMGRVPGLIITPTSGLNGAAVKVQLRGQNSLSNVDSEPLFVIDGVPYLNSIAGVQQPGLETISALSFINPNNIESIDVLKDADATAIYGSRGANGVILITTKRGKAGDAQVSGRFSTNLTTVPKTFKMMNTDQYLEMRRECYSNSGLPIPDHSTPNGEKDASNFDLTVWNPKRYTDWQKEFLSGTGVTYYGNLDVSGGNQLLQYRVAGQYSDRGTLTPGDSKFKTSNIDFSLNGRSANQKFQIGISGGYNNISDHSSDDLTRFALTLAPNAPAVYEASGNLNWEPNPGSDIGLGTWTNPLSLLKQMTETTSNIIRGNINLSYQLAKGLKFTNDIGITKTTIHSFSPHTIAAQDPATFGYATAYSATTDNSTSTFSTAPQLNYVENLFGGRLDVLLGASYQTNTQLSQVITARGYTSDALIGSLALGNSDGIGDKSNTSAEYKYLGTFGRINYNWQDKYIVNLNGRHDGSSRFGPGNQFGNFASVGGAWIFSNEDFLKDKKSVLSYGKIRSSFGTTSNDGIGDYQFLELFSAISGVNYQGLNVIGSSGAVNPNYHWESKQNLEIGFDLGFFKDRILLSASYFNAISGSQLLSKSTALTTGAGRVAINQNARIQNTGMEATISAEVISHHNFQWKITGNISFLNKNKILAFPPKDDLSFPDRINNIYDVTDPNFNAVGKPFAGIVAVYEFRGVNPQTGYYTFAKKDGTSTTGSNFDAFSSYKYAKLIDIAPKYYGGFTNSFNYRGLSLSFFIQFSKQMGKNPIYQTDGGAPGSTIFASPEFNVNRWRNPGDISSIQKVSNNIDGYFDYAVLTQSDAAWVDASFFKLKNVSLSYQLPSVRIQKIGMKGLTIFANAQNVATFTKYKGIDPEAQSIYSLAPLREVSLGFNVIF
ncbi:SusC/RagA family TonB-linked outer membrane protein [Mucilaginibacter litoreus]|uniref:SusC/RagA family TonB-linked outer membrane protein n=1 Tax=Mucilaginibacter litoreus TaxID=1048221 RepID=A0ABW3AM53_9SPHI